MEKEICYGIVREKVMDNPLLSVGYKYIRFEITIYYK